MSPAVQHDAGGPRERDGRPTRWGPTCAVLLVAPLAGCSLPAPAPLDPDRLPRSLAALGDSITRGVNLDGAAPGEHPEGSWATGNASFIANASHAERLRALGGLQDGAHNFARSGARMSDLPRQARLAVDARAEYVVVLMGANDACGRTAAETFREQLDESARILRDGLPPGARVFVASVPNVAALWDAHHENERARTAWRFFRACPAVTGEAVTDEQRAVIAESIRAYNDALREVSAANGFVYDRGAVYESEILPDDVSDLDYFHPSFSGQRRLAAATWDASPFADRAVLASAS